MLSSVRRGASMARSSGLLVPAWMAKGAVETPADVQAVLDGRAAARAAKKWAESDRLREAIAAAGWLVKDSKEGQTCMRK